MFFGNCTTPQITNKLDWIDTDGLVKGQSNYFIVINDGKWSIYEYRDNNVNKIIDNLNGINIDPLGYIVSTGLIKGVSNYFIAKKDDRWTICEHKDGIVKEITNDFDKIWSYGLVEGKSNFFILEENNKEVIYHKLLNKKIIDKNKYFSLYKECKTLIKLPLVDDKC